jgi:hypothetical protein
MTLKKKILDYLAEAFPNSVHKGELERKAVEWGCLSETINRECRKAVSGGEIIRISDGKKSSRYKLNKTIADEDVDEGLEALLKSIKVTWENEPILKEIIDAKKSNNVYRKKATIDKYRDMM